MKKTISILLLALVVLTFCAIPVFGSTNDEIPNNGGNFEADSNLTAGANLEINAKSAVLINADTGAVLYSKNASEALAPASVTKVMTLLLVAEAIEKKTISPEDMVVISANAASMGGSQVFLEEGESFSVEELLKCTVIASANDAAVALAEFVAGSESEFVARMNARAAELGMKNSCFENPTGLDDTVTKHLTSAYDIAIMSKELIKHDIILKYSNVWQDSIRNGEFTLTNTNRLVRYYSGCTGLKTGSTDKAGFCISASARRDGMNLIAVIMGSDTRDQRNEAARTLLDYGFATYALYNDAAGMLKHVKVNYGTRDSLPIYTNGFCCLVEKGDLARVEKSYDLPNKVVAPVRSGDVIGSVIYTLDGEELGRSDIYANEGADRISFFELLWRMIMSLFVG